MNKNAILLFLTALLTLIVAPTCKKPVEESTLKDVDFEVPASVTLEKGVQTLDFRVRFQKAPLTSDVIVLSSGGGQKQSCPILETSVTKFTVSINSLWNGFLADGPYEVSIRRGSEEVVKGTMTVSLVIPGDGVEPASGSTVYGRVVCGDEGLSGVAVSDGFEVVTTDENGVY